MASLLRLVAAVASALILFSFFAFAYDKAQEGSKTQVDRLADPSLTERQEAARERQHGAIREAIDDATDVLLKPFSELFDFEDPWLIRIVPSVLGLLVYGLGLTLLANFLPKSGGRTRDWRTAR